PSVAVPVPVPDAEAPREQTIAWQEDIAAITPGVASEGEGQLVVQAPTEDELPKFGEYVYVEELPEAVTKAQRVYPEMAREANVDGKVVVQALVGKDGKVKDSEVVKSDSELLNASGIEADTRWTIKLAHTNYNAVAMW